MGGLDAIRLPSLQKGKPERRHTPGRAPWEHESRERGDAPVSPGLPATPRSQEKPLLSLPRKEPAPRTDTVVSDSCPPALCESKFLFSSPSSWHFVMAALAH